MMQIVRQPDKLIKKISICFLILFAHSCIPLKIAPNIEGEKIGNAKKFKKDLPNFNGFIFEDTKNANEFYNFINAKYNLKHTFVDSNVPISINNKRYYLSFFERERTTKTLNLIPIAIDVAVESKGNDPLLENLYTSRNGSWYLILTVTDPEIRDCLNPNYPEHIEIVNYLKKLKNEYFSTNNYIEAYLKMK
ncbi:hypothetical protein [Flavobacterium limnophilum]|uniref:hypothetical protein n=1 Tax=Flavobacterium limnophilum TaxID=3003262 RepID=UPI0024827E15|nr:hypothetical protein [Flavobacterium limnophilum]